MADREEIINKIAITFAMEHDLPPKVVFQFATLLSGIDPKSPEAFGALYGLYPAITSCDHRIAFIKAVDGDRPMGPYPRTSDRCDSLINDIVHRLKKAKCMR